MELLTKIEAIIDQKAPIVSNLANIACVLFYEIKGTSWAGFYLSDDLEEKLYLGCFEGPLACTQIPFGRGVCGTSAKEKRSLLVGDVTKFAGHIACSSLSRSEVVVPIIRNNKVLGVIDLDSNNLNNFSTELVKELEEVAQVISHII